MRIDGRMINTVIDTLLLLLMLQLVTAVLVAAPLTVGERASCPMAFV